MLKSIAGFWRPRKRMPSSAARANHLADVPEPVRLPGTVEAGGQAGQAGEPSASQARFDEALVIRSETEIARPADRDRFLSIVKDFPEVRTVSSELNFRILRTAAQHCLWFGPPEEAVALFQHLTEVDRKAEDFYSLSELLANIDHRASAQALQKAMMLDPDAYDTESNRETLRLIDQTLAKKKSRKPVGINRYPSDADFRGDLISLIERHIAPEAENENKFIDTSTKFFTTGSCFARNVSLTLKFLGYEANHLEFVERINTTFASRALVEWLSGGHGDGSSRFQELVPPGWRGEQALSLIKQADVFVLTLGAAMAFFDRTTGEFVLPRVSALNSRALADRYDFRMTSVAENVANVKVLIKFIRLMNPDVTIVLTVSPVPLLVSFNGGPCVQADCISKSTMRLTAHEVVNDPEFDRIIYWPSFEVFRWVGSNNSDFYAADDGASGHVTDSKVQETIAAFIRRFKARGQSADTGTSDSCP